MMSVSEDTVERTLRYCADCLQDFKDGEQIVECANCEALLHENCKRCICEQLKESENRNG
jgi:hypothetical protein